jgi:gliding motility-associated-like protein
MNDDCSGLIDLGTVPTCPDDVFDNIDATASDIGFNNIPSCFNGGSVQRDVWFAFTLPNDITDVSISLQGVDIGPNGSILNPQIALYRGDCGFDGLALLGQCDSAPDGDTEVRLDVLGLSTNTEYYLRINEYSATGTPNSGDFQLCIEEFVPAINMGDSDETTSCFGTLFDSGGPDGDYSNGESNTFVIAPASPFQCLELELVNYQIENGFDQLNIYQGNGTAGPLLGTFTGNSTGPIQLQTSADAVTVEFTSDGSVAFPGFELIWNCSSQPCSGSSFDNPTVINSFPYNADGLTTCGAIATFAESPCGSAPFLGGEEVVFEFTTDGGFCANIALENAAAGTGILVLDGPADDPGTSCIFQGNGSFAPGVNFNNPGTYYIVVANGSGCTDFDISIEESDCAVSVALEDALCNPLNGCVSVDGLPSIFNFEPGFEDVDIVLDVNSGCWFDNGAGGFYWFTIEAQADGPFGFIFQAAIPDEASDIDFNVWGPFTQEEVCGDPESVIQQIETTQPVRSSYSGGADPTGLADINPVTGQPVTDEYDCDGNNDDYVSTIDCQEGEVYVVLVNDWGGNIESGAVSVDWSPSDPDVLAPVPAKVITSDTAICLGQSVQLEVEATIDSITWINNTNTLSCTDCFDPVATPTETTTYLAVVSGICFSDTVDVTVQVYEVDAGPDITVCQGEEIQIEAGINFIGGIYEWEAPDNVSLSCTDCPAPIVTAEEGGTTAQIFVTLTGNGCPVQDSMTLTILPQMAADYEVIDDQDICIGESVNIGGPAGAGVQYSWTSLPTGFTSNEADPLVTPQQTTTYFLLAVNGECPLPSQDSVTISVFTPPVIEVANDTAICQGDTVLLGSTEIENNTTYQWSGPPEIVDPTDPNTLAFPQESGQYTLTATRGACVVEDQLQVDITPIAIEILEEDSLRICIGTEVTLESSITPAGDTPLWTSTQAGFDSTFASSITVTPQTQAMYYAETGVENCFRIDSVLIIVDSLPTDLSIMPMDTVVCEGSTLVFTSPLYEPSDYEDIEFMWTPEAGQETPDSLYNMVITAQRGVEAYQRITTKGVCVDTAIVELTVDTIPDVSIVPADTTVCPGETVQLTVNTGGAMLEDFEWTQGADQLSCTDCFDPIAGPINGAITFVAEAESGECPVSVSAIVSSFPEVPYELQTQNVICLGDELQLIFNTSPDATYTWTSTDPDFGEVEDGNLVVSPDTTTTYFLTAEFGDCGPVQEELTIEVVGEVSLELFPEATTICEGDAVQIEAVAEGGSSVEVFVWTGSDGSEIEGSVIEVSPTETTTYTLNYFDGNGCNNLTESVTINVEEGVLVEGIFQTPADTVLQGDQVTLFVEVSGSFEPNELTFTWFAGEEEVASGQGLTEIQQTLPEAGMFDYTVVVSTPTGCTYTVQGTVEVLPLEFVMPNAFTPNNDDQNDFFNFVSVFSNDLFTVREFKVYNRWGQLVYDNETPDTGWDGSFNGTPQPSEVYYYFIRLGRGEGEDALDLDPLQGDVTLVR